MKDIVLYCKSYRQDFLRLKRLLQSIQQFNVDKIDFYISTPEADKFLLDQIIGLIGGYTWVSDESIFEANERAKNIQLEKIPGRLSQQIIKAEFWRLNFCENYICIDSDSYFIKEFRKNDFLSQSGVLYSIFHQNKDFFQLAANRNRLKVISDLTAESVRVKELFQRQGPNFFCAPSPFLWSRKVWESLDKQYLQPRNILIWDLISPAYPESLIYGEALLKFNSIPIIAIEPLFRTYHYDWYYFLLKRTGENEKKVKENYLGIVHQSAWDLDLHFGNNGKSGLSNFLKLIKQKLKLLQSFF